MSRGKPISRSAWPASGPVLDWLRYLDRVHRANGVRSQREVARAMGLSSPTRVGLLVGGRALPADPEQARSLLAALGALDDEVAAGLRLYRKAAADPPAATPDWWTRSGYLERVRDIAPRDLLGRDAELAALAAFCAGDVAYARWQAPARAGKTALFSWFALHPPPGTWVLSFFVTARLTGYSDSIAYSDALLDQMAALTGEAVPPDALAGVRDRMRHQLLRLALQRAATSGHRLVILVDGLDEDRGVRPGSGLPSIASLLPKRPEPHLRVLVAGRPDPPLPTDVDTDHPLRTAVIHELSPSPHARAVALLADQELNEALAGPDRLNEEVLGLVTAAGGGLTGDDMQQLTGRARYELDALLHGVFGRTLAERDSVYLYTHETLREQAVHRFGPHRLGEYRSRLAAWARTYRDRGWPASTPPYLLRSYQLMLADAGDLPGLAALATDRDRHDRMLAVTGGDAAGLAEVAAAQQMVGRQPVPDVVLAARLAFHRDALTARNHAVPVRLPAVWARLGRQVRAEAMAYGVTDGHRRALTLAALAEALAETGHRGSVQSAVASALAAAESVTDRFRRAESLAAVAAAVAAAGDLTRAREITRRVENGLYHAEALAAVAEAVARSGDLPAATALAREISHPIRRGDALTAVAAHDRSPAAGALTREIPHLLQRAYALARAGHLAEAEAAHATWTRSTAPASPTPDPPAPASPAPASQTPASPAPEPPAPASPAPGSPTPRSQTPEPPALVSEAPGESYALARAHAAMSVAAARSGDSDAAAAHAGSADRAARRVPARWRVPTSIALTDTTGEHRHLEDAIGPARAIGDPDRRANALAALAEAAARHGLPVAADLAEESGTAARTSIDLHAHERRSRVLTETMINLGELSRAEALTREAPASQRGTLMAELAAAYLRAGDARRGRALADAALADEYPNSHRRNEALTGLPALLAELDPTEAVRLCERIEPGHPRALASLALARAVAERDPAGAARLVRSAARESDTTDVLVALATLGEVDQALTLAGNKEEPWSRHHSRVEILRAAPTPALAALIEAETGVDSDLDGIAEVLAGAGMADHAERVAGRARDARHRSVVHARMAGAAARRDPVRAAGWSATAESAVRACPDGFARDHALSLIAAAYAEVRDTAAAYRTIAAISSVVTRIEAALRVGGPELIALADAAVAAVPDLRDRDRLRAELALVSPDGAAHAEQITDGALRAGALMAVGGRAVEALTHAHWEHTVRRLASSAPEAAIAIADEFLHTPLREPAGGRPPGEALVLVIDDQDSITELYERMLTRAGYRVEVRLDGASGVRAAGELRPDLVLTGIAMPGWSGWRVIHHLRRISDVPILVASGHHREIHRARACAQGTDGLLGKPFTASDLDRAAERLLNRPGRPAYWLRGNGSAIGWAPTGVPEREG
ncbi:response regulator [Actinoplanes xinjiangensis]|uniref:response regulator n=1 Tax=Actinoplanes xinjiangensis TaxID=512350 RepID=UPI00341A4087